MPVHSTMLGARGLPWLPSSVLAKSELVSSTGVAGALAEVGSNILEQVSKPAVLSVTVLTLLLARLHRVGRRPETARNDRLYLIFLGGILAAHLVAGKHGQGRYETYLLLAGLLVLLWVFRDSLAGLWARHPRRVAWLLILATLVSGYRQVDFTFRAPAYARLVQDTNGQMRRFAVDHWRDGVAVNDVGWVSYRNPHYVLDLWGLANEPARRMRRSAEDLAWAERLVQEREVALVIVFEDWFRHIGELPSSWEPLARLERGHPALGSCKPLSLFLTDPTRRSEALAALRAFGTTLPDSVELVLD